MGRIDRVDFVNSVNKILQDFITTEYRDGDIYDVYVAFDFPNVQKTFSKIEEGSLAPKPVVHIVNEDAKDEAKVFGGVSNKVTKVNMIYSVFIVVDDNIQAGVPRKMLLNKLSSKLKSKLDNRRDKLPEFKKVDINYSEGVSGKNADSLYASSQKLILKVIKDI